MARLRLLWIKYGTLYSDRDVKALQEGVREDLEAAGFVSDRERLRARRLIG